MRLFDDYKIGGKSIIAPDADIQIVGTDLDSDSTGRDESGFMHRDVLRYRVKNWELSYSSLSAEEYVYMQSLTAGKPYFDFQYKDIDGTVKTVKAYCSNDSITYRNAVTGDYRNYKIKIIEC